MGERVGNTVKMAARKDTETNAERGSKKDEAGHGREHGMMA